MKEVYTIKVSISFNLPWEVKLVDKKCQFYYLFLIGKGVFILSKHLYL